MQKNVASVIASARALIRRPSEAKLATDDMRLLLHQLLEELHVDCIKEDADFYTHDLPIELTYNEDSQGYTFVVNINPEGTRRDVDNILPVFLRFQPITSDANKDPWYRVNITKLTTFTRTNGGGRVQAAYLGNNWQGITDPQFKFNVEQEFVTNHDWRIAFRLFPTDVLDYDDIVPFMPEHTSLLEVILAGRALELVNDDSPSWVAFKNRQQPALLMREQMGRKRLMDWMYKDAENIVIDTPMYDYKYNNPQAGRGTRRPRTEWA